ncbi:unnamed protein product, partial [Mesorhabditis spiculigera]
MLFSEIGDTFVAIFRPIIYLPALAVKLPNDTNFPILTMLIGAEIYFLSISGMIFTYFSSGVSKRRLLDNTCAICCVTTPGICIWLGVMGFEKVPFLILVGQISLLIIECHSLCNAMAFIFCNCGLS